MGLKNWLLDISCNKCRDNFIRGIPMFIACCQRVDAYGQQQSMARDRETKEAQRLYNMLLGNALHGPLVYDEVLKLLVPVAMAAQTIGETAHIGLRRIVAAVIEESEKEPSRPKPGEATVLYAGQWYRRAAEQGSPIAQYIFGEIYASGQDYSQAAQWYRRAADQGHAGAQYALAAMNADGKGVPQDNSQAVQWLQQAAQQGHMGAQYALSSMYTFAQGVPQDDNQAVQWLQRAAQQGFADAQCQLGVMYQQGRGIPQSSTQAAQWFQQAAEQGQVDAQFNLGLMYEAGFGVPQDDAQAEQWYQRAAAQGYAMAHNMLNQL